MTYSRKWLQFIKERFNPLVYSAMILVFLGAHYAVSSSFLKPETSFDLEKAVYLSPLVLAVFLFFFKLRLFDEVKDMESDAVHHPERPLPRGLLRKNDILGAVFLIIVLEILLFSFYGLRALTSMIIAIGYSLAMYKEFFIKKWLRARLTTYAITHTFIVVFISTAVFSALLNESLIKLPTRLLSFSIGGWFLFTIFEFGRKTFAQQEEKEGIDSYSKTFGRFGAVLSVLIMAVLSAIFIGNASSLAFLWICTIAILGFLYAVSNRPHLAKIYRLATSLYIIFTYATVIFLQCCRGLV